MAEFEGLICKHLEKYHNW